MVTALHKLRRRLFGRYAIDDPRPVAASAPYTYYLPSENELLALAPGDFVKLVIRSIPPGAQWDAERMWVAITSIHGDRLLGSLENEPFDMPQPKLGASIAFSRSDVIDIDWAEGRSVRPPSAPQHRWYWERCMVDRCVVEEGVPVEYIYREQPDMTREGDEHEDSGWRIRGDGRNVEANVFEAREADYIPLGKVLNVDDSWLHLIDRPVGCAFIKDWDTGRFVPAE